MDICEAFTSILETGVDAIMGCAGFNNGNCSYFKKKVQKCPVAKSARDMFGDMKWCLPVEEAMGGKKNDKNADDK